MIKPKQPDVCVFLSTTEAGKRTDYHTSGALISASEAFVTNLKSMDGMRASRGVREFRVAASPDWMCNDYEGVSYGNCELVVVDGAFCYVMQNPDAPCVSQTDWVAIDALERAVTEAIKAGEQTINTPITSRPTLSVVQNTPIGG